MLLVLCVLLFKKYGNKSLALGENFKVYPVVYKYLTKLRNSLPNTHPTNKLMCMRLVLWPNFFNASL